MPTSLSFRISRNFFALILVSLVAQADADDQRNVRVLPEQISLNSPEATDQLLVFERMEDGRERDVTRETTYSVQSPGVVEISATGRITPLQDGHVELLVKVAGDEIHVPVTTSGITNAAPVSFRHDVIPILSKAGCNSGGCHGKAAGQNGFKLSVFGYDAVADFDAIVRDSHGRRVFPAAPESSLLLAKSTGKVPHGGGVKIETGSRWHRLLLRWISKSMRLDEETKNPVAEIIVEPREVTLTASGSQQLRVVAIDQAGRTRGVTAESDFQSNNDVIAGVNRDGLIEATDVPGEAAILVRYMGHVAVCRVNRPRSEGSFARPPENNFVDRLIWDKLERLKVAPSDLGDDAIFVRRVFLDTIGTLPTSAEARAFLTDNSPDKRSQLITALLNRPEYADYWAQQWTDLLQVDKDIVTPQGAMAMSRWIHSQFQNNVPFDQFARAVLTAEGSTVSESPAAFYQVQSDPEKAARAVSQLFLGVRIECAQCHHHPFEKWDRQDYYAWAGFFTGIDHRAGSAGSQKIVNKTGEELKHPLTGLAVPVAALGAEPTALPAGSNRRQVMADWLTSPQNPYFTRTIVNRLVAHYFGRGLVDPVDDLRATNPASNEPLMQALVHHMAELKYDQKAFTATLLNSHAYQLSSIPNDSNTLDEQNYSHASWKPVPAEVLLDAISQVTEVPEQFNGWPPGYRAIQIWDNKLPSHFLEVFGRPTRQTVCSCERGTEPSIAQALHLMNSETTIEKIEHRNGIAARLAASSLTDQEIVDELYLTALSRFPADAERQLMLPVFTTSGIRRQTVEDILWTLLNTKEFVFNH
ncbi:MAG TPA: DUF1549 and DUF1553 domain-containing protein [Planctomycetaceae bacterium]|nr:DUF1549 and DUF1553 domain-containing protein [Planctomycetaceae bacterium]